MTFPSSFCEVRTWHRCAAPTSRHASPWAGSGAARVSQNRGNDSLFPGNKCPRAQLVCLILGQPAAAISPASLGRAGRVFGCLQSNKQSAGASEATISKTPRWAGRRSLKQNCQSKELVSLATLVVEIGLRVGAKKHAQKSGEQLLPVRGAESPQTRSRAGGEMKFWEVQGWEMQGDGQNGVLWGRRRMPQPWKCRRPQDGRGSGQPGVVQGVLEVPPHPSPDPPRTRGDGARWSLPADGRRRRAGFQNSQPPWFPCGSFSFWGLQRNSGCSKVPAAPAFVQLPALQAGAAAAVGGLPRPPQQLDPSQCSAEASPSPGVSGRAMDVGWGEAPPEQGMLPQGAARGLGGEAHPPHQLRASGPFPPAPSAAAHGFGANCWPRFSCSTLVRWQAGLTAPPRREVTPGAPQQEPGPRRTSVPSELQDAGGDPRGAVGEGTGRSPAKPQGSGQAVTRSWALSLPGNCSCACPRLEKSGKMRYWDTDWFRSCSGLGAGSSGPCFLLLPVSIPVEMSPGD